MNILDAILDPELGCVSFSVERITYTRSRTGVVSSSQTIQAMGCIHPGPAETIQLLPEEERNEEYIVVYTDCVISAGTPETTSPTFTGPDRIHWNDQVWRVVKVKDWQSFGYTQAYAVLMREET